jgi:hypothetical protein
LIPHHNSHRDYHYSTGIASEEETIEILDKGLLLFLSLMNGGKKNKKVDRACA